ncbi:hypothetical protein KC354_g12891 [Hortaea werneckii]|nr:hypothetical protein KC354_g12891 [Hortaea werneckii]
MPLGEALDDDFVASILARDASLSASQGYSQVPSSKPRRKDAPRPNTRFLRNLVRDADTHNTALRAKEEEEARRKERERKRRWQDEKVADGPEKRRKEGDRPGRRHSTASDSDPLDELIGPKPPSTVIPRGRGATAGSSTIDQRFRPDYDPRADIQNSPSPERGHERLGDDWDLALEALRDRAKWKAQGGDRLKAAGFTDEEVDRWKDGGREKDERDVQWRKSGEGREWDRGKTIEGEHVEVKASWARKSKS